MEKSVWRKVLIRRRENKINREREILKDERESIKAERERNDERIN